jgi:hypothetical protein
MIARPGQSMDKDRCKCQSDNWSQDIKHLLTLLIKVSCYKTVNYPLFLRF